MTVAAISLDLHSGRWGGRKGGTVQSTPSQRHAPFASPTPHTRTHLRQGLCARSKRCIRCFNSPAGAVGPQIRRRPPPRDAHARDVQHTDARAPTPSRRPSGALPAPAACGGRSSRRGRLAALLLLPRLLAVGGHAAGAIGPTAAIVVRLLIAVVLVWHGGRRRVSSR